MESTVAGAILANLEGLAARLPAIREGDGEAIHDGRVATRRLRAALPLVGIRRRSEDSAGEAATSVRALGRALGRARDTDEALALVDDIERRSPGTAPAAASLRARLLPEQLRQRRRLIKTLESLDLGVLSHLHDAIQRGTRFPHRLKGSSIRARLAAVVLQRIATVREKVHHASGVYFPNRAHHARVAIKKLRYAAELIEPGEAVRKRALRSLKEAQDALGRVHDREMLLRRLMAQAEDDGVPGARDLARVLEAESRALFESYRGLRPAVAAVCDSLEEWSQRVGSRPAASRLFVVGAIALPSAALIVAGRARRAG
jgi:CHAD domain-containing protein